MFWFVVDRPIVDTRDTAAELKKEHVRRGEPGKGLTAKALVAVRKAMQSGQDSYRQRYGGSLGPGQYHGRGGYHCAPCGPLPGDRHVAAGLTVLPHLRCGPVQ